MLQSACETYARQATMVLTSSLRSPALVAFRSIEQQRYGDYVQSLGDATAITIYAVPPLSRHAILQTPLSVAMSCVDQLLGGPGTAQQPDRPLSMLEASVIQGLLERLGAEIKYAFSHVVAIEPRMADVESSPQMVQIAAASDVMAVARFDIRLGEVTSEATLCLSFSDLLPHLTASEAAAANKGRDEARRAEAAEAVNAGFQDVPVDVAVRFRSTRVGGGTLGNLAVGDVIRLDHPAQAPLDVMAADVVVAHATAGTHGKRLACLVVATPAQENR